MSNEPFSDESAEQDHSEDAPEREEVGVGPHPLPWPEADHFDPELLAEGDRRNVVDKYRYWKREAVVADLDLTRSPMHVAIENWEHDFNIGTVVRNANAFNTAGVHIIGKRKWNRRGAMVTDRYHHVHQHPTVDEFISWADSEQLPVIGIDNLPGSVALEHTELPEACVMVFGQEGPGLSEAVRERSQLICSIAQFGSTRSINAGVASGIALHTWLVQHRLPEISPQPET